MASLSLPSRWHERLRLHGLPGLCVFDFDMTCTQNDSTLAIAPNTVNGEHIIEASSQSADNLMGLTNDLAGLLKGETKFQLQQRALHNIEFSKGLAEFVQLLRSNGSKILVISGGFHPAVSLARTHFGIDVICNDLQYDVTGRATGCLGHAPVVDAASKGKLVSTLQSLLGVSQEDTMAVGDSANDCSMFRVAAYRIGVQPKPVLQGLCDVELPTHDFRPLTAMLEPFSKTAKPATVAKPWSLAGKMPFALPGMPFGLPGKIQMRAIRVPIGRVRLPVPVPVPRSR